MENELYQQYLLRGGCGSIKVILDPALTLLGLKGLKGVTKQEKT
jgi:hypothetical protein